MRQCPLIAFLPVSLGVLVLAASCSGSSPAGSPADAGVNGSGGQGAPAVGSGGGVGNISVTGSGGQLAATGGEGGAVLPTGDGTGGARGTGGVPGTAGGAGRGPGGATGGNRGVGGGTGGRATGGTTGGGGTGGISGTGGIPGTGGMMGTGGVTSTTCTLPASPNNGAGSFTFYNFGQGTARAQEGNGFRTACGYFGTESGGSGSDMVQNTVNPTYFAAIPGRTPADFNSSSACGACAQISNAGRTVIVTVIDECPQNSNPVCNGNPGGHLDLSVPAFNALGFPVGNPSGTTWKFVPCPVMGNVKVRFKTGNPNEIFIENEILPIRSVTMSGQTAVRQSYGAWHFAANIPAGATLTLVDSANRTIMVTVSGTAANQNQDTGRQFPTCQ